MKSVINLYKPVGMTPLEAIEKFREENKKYSGVKMSYSGRLDPMACGVLLLLIGEENKKINNYMKLDKEYRAKILLGFSSDSFDILGVVNFYRHGNLEVEKIKKTLKLFQGVYKQKLPVYSSYKIKGKPLFYYARFGLLNKIEVPVREVKIKKINIKNVYKIGSGKLLKEIVEKVSKVKGDFRQNEILEKWKKLLKEKDDKYFVVDVVIKCSSGTYIRAIADDFGFRLGCGGLLLNLERLRVGKFLVQESERLK